MRATIIQCVDCFGLVTYINGVGSGKRPVPGTGRLDCGHLETDSLGEVAVTHLVHVALSTLLRRPEVLADRDTVHTIQEWMRTLPSYHRTNGLPWTLTDGHDVSSAGLATARILASLMSSITVPSEAFYWSAAARIMRVRMYR